MNVSRPNRALGQRRAGYGGEQEPRVQGPEIESAVESVGESGEVLSTILSEGKRVITARKAGLEITSTLSDSYSLFLRSAFVTVVECHMS
jgi:hypothetical protein